MAAKKNGYNADKDINVMANDIAYIRSDVRDIKTTLVSNYVTKDQFDPVKRIVYGVASLVMVALVGAFMALILKK